LCIWNSYKTRCFKVHLEGYFKGKLLIFNRLSKWWLILQLYKGWYNFHIKYNHILGNHFYFTLGFLQYTRFSTVEHSSFFSSFSNSGPSLFYSLLYMWSSIILSISSISDMILSEQEGIFFFINVYSRERGLIYPEVSVY